MYGKRLLWPFIAAIVFLLSPALALADEPTKAWLATEAQGVTVGDPVQLVLTVVHPEDHYVILPELEQAWGDFVVHSQAPPTTVANGDGTATTSQVIDVRLFAPGSFGTPPLEVTASGSDGQPYTVHVTPANVIVSSVLVEGDTELRDIKPQADLPFAALMPWVIGGLALLTILACIAGVVLWRRRRAATAAADNRPPHQVALDELVRIEQLRLPEKGRFKKHYTLVSDCVRVYGERSFGIPVLERTTSEVRAGLKATDLSPALRHSLLGLLGESDLVKFARFTPDVPSANLAIARARHIVDETRPRPPVAESGGADPPTPESGDVPARIDVESDELVPTYGQRSEQPEVTR